MFLQLKCKVKHLNEIKLSKQMRFKYVRHQKNTYIGSALLTKSNIKARLKAANKVGLNSIITGLWYLGRRAKSKRATSHGSHLLRELKVIIHMSTLFVYKTYKARFCIVRCVIWFLCNLKWLYLLLLNQLSKSKFLNKDSIIIQQTEVHALKFSEIIEKTITN